MGNVIESLSEASVRHGTSSHLLSKATLVASNGSEMRSNKIDSLMGKKAFDF